MIKYIKKNYYRIILFSISVLVSAINFNLLLKPVSVVAGGSGGLALVLQNILPISTSHIIAIIYVITVILSIIFLEKKTVASIILASILYPLCTYLTEDITNVIHLNYYDVFLVCIVSGVIGGITNGITYRYGYATGGIGVLAPILNKYLKTSISKVNFGINTIIVLMGIYYYGFNMVIYAIVLLYITSYVSNLVILGLSNNKVIFIESDKCEKIMNMLYTKYNLSVTILDDNKILMAVVKDTMYSSVKFDLKKVDKNVFFTTNNCYEVGH